jgi:hypothetical protein
VITGFDSIRYVFKHLHAKFTALFNMWYHIKKVAATLPFKAKRRRMNYLRKRRSRAWRTYDTQICLLYRTSRSLWAVRAARQIVVFTSGTFSQFEMRKLRDVNKESHGVTELLLDTHEISFAGIILLPHQHSSSCRYLWDYKITLVLRRNYNIPSSLLINPFGISWLTNWNGIPCYRA